MIYQGADMRHRLLTSYHKHLVTIELDPFNPHETAFIYWKNLACHLAVLKLDSGLRKRIIRTIEHNLMESVPLIKQG
jgi:hypothetical protein